MLIVSSINLTLKNINNQKIQQNKAVSFGTSPFGRLGPYASGSNPNTVSKKEKILVKAFESAGLPFQKATELVKEKLASGSTPKQLKETAQELKGIGV